MKETMEINRKNMKILVETLRNDKTTNNTGKQIQEFLAHSYIMIQRLLSNSHTGGECWGKLESLGKAKYKLN